MFEVYFQSFLFIHIYIFTKSLIQQASKRNNQLQKEEFMNQFHTPIHNKNNAPRFHMILTHNFIPMHATMHKHPKLQTHAAQDVSLTEVLTAQSIPGM